MRISIIKMNNIYITILISFLFCQIDTDPRLLGLSGASTTIARGYSSIGNNPANLATNKSLSMSSISLNISMVNNFLSPKIYNDINGADFENTASASYYSKSELLDEIKGENINLQATSFAPFPFLNFAYKKFGISVVNRTYFSFDMPKSILDIILNGNTKDERFLLGLSGNAMSANEFGLSYAHQFTLDDIPIQIGLTFKYLQGLAYIRMKDIESNGSYILTEQTSFHGSGKYLVEQAFGGAGTAKDIGLLLPDFADGWSFGFSVINMGGNIKWDSANLTKSLMGSSIEELIGLRQNEFHYISFNIDSMNILSYNTNPDMEFISSNSYKVGIFSDIPLESEASPNDLLVYTIDDLGDSTLKITNYNEIDTLLVVDLGDGSYLVPSERLESNQLQSQTSKDIHLDYPSYLRIGASKEINNYGLISFDLLTGFDTSFGNSNKFRFSFGTEITRVSSNFPIRLGFSLGGDLPSSYSIGFGYRTGPLFIDFGRKYYHGIIRNRAKGIELGLNVSIDMTDFNSDELFRFKRLRKFIQKIKTLKIPQLPN